MKWNQLSSKPCPHNQNSQPAYPVYGSQYRDLSTPESIPVILVVVIDIAAFIIIIKCLLKTSWHHFSDGSKAMQTLIPNWVDILSPNFHPPKSSSSNALFHRMDLPTTIINTYIALTLHRHCSKHVTYNNSLKLTTNLDIRGSQTEISKDAHNHFRSTG